MIRLIPALLLALGLGITAAQSPAKLAGISASAHVVQR